MQKVTSNVWTDTTLRGCNPSMVVTRDIVALGLGRSLGREMLAGERAHIVEVHLLGGVQFLVGIG